MVVASAVLVMFLCAFSFVVVGGVFVLRFAFVHLIIFFSLRFETPLNWFESPSFINFSRDDNEFIRIMTGWCYLTLYARIDYIEYTIHTVCMLVLVRIVFALSYRIVCLNVRLHCIRYLNHNCEKFPNIALLIILRPMPATLCVQCKMSTGHGLYGSCCRKKFYRTHLF